MDYGTLGQEELLNLGRYFFQYCDRQSLKEQNYDTTIIKTNIYLPKFNSSSWSKDP